jgi:hypothetical protein
MVTHPRVFTNPDPIRDALNFTAARLPGLRWRHPLDT